MIVATTFGMTNIYVVFSSRSTQAIDTEASQTLVQCASNPARKWPYRRFNRPRLGGPPNRSFRRESGHISRANSHIRY